MTRDGSGSEGDEDGDGVKRAVRRHWDGRAATFDDEVHHGIHTDEQRERWLSVLDAWVDDPPRRVLDAGCGTGVVSLLLAELGHDVTGVDFAPGMLDRARAKAAARARLAGSARFLAGDATRLAAPDGAYDALTARHLLWTLPDPAGALREWRRVVRPGGRVVLVEGRWDHDEPRGEYRAVHGDLPLYDGRPPHDLCDRLEASGFVGVDAERLMDPTLWGRDPRHEYYVVAGTVPEA
ncbi:class I SAM-dependent methyltransferase [Candidatus Halobonum tyrrellensis]|uniref:Type 11 methyltransferase n=1 Tax=Candidatus Halobonum tyrrellensis G22 TaxID=1324957 RepID=V4GS00_9EURY|nr:class I SAM-dependent methyltransferase [Candidatus Halobonum tyrrellensis]ESP87826.1 type 11 methyltransferase [Candidatus Halobonum tyrrellensis G22]